MLVLSPVQGQPGEVLELNAVSQTSQFCMAVDSSTLPVSVNTDQVANVSLVPGASCSSALNNLQSATTALAAVVSALNTSNIANVSTVAGATCTAALDTLRTELTAVQASVAALLQTAGQPGYVSSHVYVNAASPRVGTVWQGITIEAAVTWTTAAQIPPGNWFQVDVAPAGGSGASGMCATNTQGGGTGAGGAPRNRKTFSRAELVAALPIVISAALGQNGGLGVSVTGTATSAGNLGVDGGSASFGNLCCAFGGSGANGSALSSNRAGGAGGGQQSAGTAANTGGGSSTGGGLGGTTTQPTEAFSGAGCIVAVNGRPAEYGGASGAGAPGSTNATGLAGGSSRYGGGGGGAGGGAATGAASAGGPGGVSGGIAATVLSNGTNDGGPAGGAVGANGTNGADGDLTHNGQGGAGGGGSNSTGGNGGNGGFPGGAGGGGGSASRVSGNVTSGSGGRAGDAAVIVLGFL